MDDIIVLLRIYKTTIQMLNDRKYDMKNYLDHLSYSRDDFISNFGKTDEINIDLNKLEMNFNKIDNEQDRKRVMDALSESADQHLNLFVTAMLGIGVLLQEGQKNENDN